jgi:hypothetical protein
MTPNEKKMSCPPRDRGDIVTCERWRGVHLFHVTRQRQWFIGGRGRFRPSNYRGMGSLICNGTSTLLGT